TLNKLGFMYLHSYIYVGNKSRFGRIGTRIFKLSKIHPFRERKRKMVYGHITSIPKPATSHPGNHFFWLEIARHTAKTPAFLSKIPVSYIVIVPVLGKLGYYK
ncbi:hypothetical protein ACJX0J_033405, partial [Zea mays]